jgi:hypothetical protein
MFGYRVNHPVYIKYIPFCNSELQILHFIGSIPHFTVQFGIFNGVLN